MLMQLMKEANSTNYTCEMRILLLYKHQELPECKDVQFSEEIIEIVDI